MKVTLFIEKKERHDNISQVGVLSGSGLLGESQVTVKGLHISQVQFIRPPLLVHQTGFKLPM